MSLPPAPLARSFYARDTTTVARDLLGCLLVREGVGIARIVETEAYVGPHDLASHSAKGITARTKVMFGAAGYAYVYLIYGMYECFNVVTDVEGHGAAVLVRGLQAVTPIAARLDGPGRLTRAMHITRDFYGHDLTLARDLWIASRDQPIGRIHKGPRVGVDYAKHWAKRHLRFWLDYDPK